MRQTVRLQGQVLVQKGILRQVDDVFFMRRSELLDSFVQPAISLKRIEARKNRRLRQIQQHLDVLSRPRTVASPGASRLEGFGVSKGVIRGRARIAFSLKEARLAEGGEILIAHSADPAWSPIFSVISGMVLETGGILSHASIVAREFGLPTVTGVANATTVIRDGDLLEINGETGIVEIIG